MARLPYTSVRDLLASGEKFGATLPALAGALSQATTEGPLERVREGLFYLGAVSMDRTRELEAEGQRAIADVVAPDLLRPVPAATIVQLVSERSVRRVPAGAEVRTNDARPCRFRTVAETRVGPWRAENARMDGARPEAWRFDLVATGSSTLAEAMAGATPRFFVEGAEGALRLLGHILAHTSHAELSLDGNGPPVRLGPVCAYGTSAEEALAPEPDGPPTGLGFMREYFLLPERFRFFGIDGLVEVLRGSPSRHASVILTFAEPLPVQATVAPAGIRAHCVPATNLFPSFAEPWVFEPGRSSAPIRVAGLSRDEGGVYGVTGAFATPRGGDDVAPVALRPVRRFAAGPSAPGYPAFSTKLMAAPDRDDPDVLACLTTPRGRAPMLAPHVVSLDLLATNRARASRLRPGELCEGGAGMPPGVRARNITPCSPYVPPPVGAELALQAAVRAAVPDGDPLFALQSQLLALVPRRGVDAATVRANVARIEAIRRLEIAKIVDRSRGRRGYEVRLSMDEAPFQGLGDLALFLRVLHATLETQVTIGRFYRCVATCTRSGSRLAWPPEPEAA